VPSAPPAVRARTVLITNRTGPASITSGANPKLTRLGRDRLRRLPVTICSAPTAKASHTSGSMARRDQPRADRQCRTIKVSTIAVTARLTKPPMVLTVSRSDREPSPISSTLAGHPVVQPTKAGFQNIAAATLKPMSCA